MITVSPVDITQPMLVRMTAEQVQHFWPIVREAIIEAHRGFSQLPESYLSKCLQLMLEGRMQCWGLIQADTLYAICITHLLEDAFFETKALLLFTLYGLQEITAEMWRIGYTTLCVYARQLGCNALEAYANSQYIVDKAHLFGGKTRIYIRMEV